MVKAFSGFGNKIWLWDVETLLDQYGVPRVRVCNVPEDIHFEIKFCICHCENESIGFAEVCTENQL